MSPFFKNLLIPTTSGCSNLVVHASLKKKLYESVSDFSDPKFLFAVCYVPVVVLSIVDVSFSLVCSVTSNFAMWKEK